MGDAWLNMNYLNLSILHPVITVPCMVDKWLPLAYGADCFGARLIKWWGSEVPGSSWERALIISSRAGILLPWTYAGVLLLFVLLTQLNGGQSTRKVQSSAICCAPERVHDTYASYGPNRVFCVSSLQYVLNAFVSRLGALFGCFVYSRYPWPLPSKWKWFIMLRSWERMKGKTKIGTQI